MKFKSVCAFSMVEVMVAALVFTLAAAGVLTAMSRSRLPVTSSDKRLQAAAYGKQILDGLRSNMSVDSWNGPDWTTGAPHVITSNPDFGAQYNVALDASGGKQVNLTVSW